MSMARHEIGTTRNVVVKSPNASLWMPDVLPGFWCDEAFWLSSGTLDWPFLLGGFLPVVAVVSATFEQRFYGPDQGLSAGAQFTDPVPGDLFEQALAPR